MAQRNPESTTIDGAKHEKSKVEKSRELKTTGEKGKQSLIGSLTYPVPPVARIVTICLAVVVVHLQFGEFEAREAGR